MHQTKKGQTWHFGMQAHVGTDLQGIVHQLTTTAAHVADITQLPRLLHGAERVLHGDQAYWSAFYHQCAEAHGVHYRDKEGSAFLKRQSAVHSVVARTRTSTSLRPRTGSSTS